MTDYSATSRARLATRLAFFSAGFAMACCAPLFPFVKANVGASEGQFGLLLLFLGLGSVIAMPVTGIIAARYGAASMVRLGGGGMAMSLPFVGLADSGTALAIVLFLFGASLGTIDVAMNVHGAEIEIRERRPLMSGFHAQFSIGGFCGAALMTALLSLGVSVIYALVLGAAVVLVAVVLTATRLLQVSGAAPEALAFPRGIVLLLAALAAITFLAEGAVLDWGALLIVERDLASVQNAGMGYILFSVAMVAARLTGDRIVAALGEFYVLVFGGILAIAGVAVILLSPWPVVALTGFILIGLGAANIVPVVFSIAGRQTIMPAGLAIASVTTTGYAGILLGPTLIGFAAQQISLPNAFWILVVLLAIIPLTARAAVKA